MLQIGYRIAHGLLAPEETIKPSGFARKPNEQFWFHSVACGLHAWRTNSVWAGGYGGVSVRVAKGLSVRRGIGAGKPVDISSELEEVDSGELFVSDVRVVFVGQNKFLDLPLARVAVSSELGWLNINTSYRGANNHHLFGWRVTPWAPIAARHVIEYVQQRSGGGA